MQDFKNIKFESQRLLTKRLHKADAEALFHMYSDAEAMKYRGSQPMKHLDDAHAMIADQEVIDNPISKIRLALWTKTTHQLIGTLLLKMDDTTPHQCEIGFSFGKQYWGQGYGQESLQMVQTHFYKHKHFEELVAWCIKENTASNRIFEKAGFQLMAQSEFPQSNFYLKKIDLPEYKCRILNKK